MAPKGMKRASTGKEEPPAKRGKVDKDLRKAGSIAAALKASTLPRPVVKSLRSIVVNCLTGYAGERHAFQETGLTMIESALKDVEAAAAKEVEDVQAKLANRDQDLAGREAAIGTAAREEASKIGEAANKAADLTIVGNELKHAEDALKQAADAQKAGDAPAAKLEAKLAKLEAAQKDSLAPALSAALTRKEGLELDKVLLKAGVEASIVNSLLNSTTKAPEERGDFDKVVLSNVESDIATKMQELKAEIDKEAPGKTERAAAKDKAQAAYDAAKEKRDAAKAALTEAEKAVKAAQKALADAKSKVSGFSKEMKAAETGITAAQKKLAALREGPIALFATLKARTPPPPPAEEPAAEAAAAA
eukprot:TRINITY_DN17929_c0_g1_i1.p1 TRINITY_DN17929_c0_g1~~TRINITY_DN17929_c0_g1_i1.p1  ORF type:complete len:386 (+),score=186.95 TRINITY_DN17929_c0_g1_i1:74-1159(+)